MMRDLVKERNVSHDHDPDGGRIGYRMVFSWVFFPLHAQTKAAPVARRQPMTAMDRDLMEVTIPKLERLYRERKYTVTEVVGWYIARIHRYNGVYGAIENLDAKGALATAGSEDAEAKVGRRR